MTSPLRLGFFVRLACAAAVVAMPSMLALPGCSATMPGTTLGMYEVSGTIQSNTCGANTGAPNPWTFTVQLSKDSTTLYWNWLDGTPLLSGPLVSGVTTTIDGTEADNLGGPDAGLDSCSMQRADTLALTLASESAPATFTGTMTYAFSVTSGNCAAQMSSGGGMYDVLPCSTVYTLAATKK